MAASVPSTTTTPSSGVSPSPPTSAPPDDRSHDPGLAQRPGPGHLPGLDGMRALAVIAVVVFHLWPDVLPGGFLGVSVFFSLSGYLIVTLLLSEMERSGGVDVRGFYRRRIRRLLPAALATVAVISVVWMVAGWLTTTTSRELIAATLQVSNWQRIIDGQAYGADATTSPVLHFWSLAIEEQIYLVLPVLVVAARTRRRLGIWLMVAFAASVSYTVWFAGQATVIYYSTFSRAGEVLAGALMAVVLAGVQSTARRGDGRQPGRTRPVVAGVGAVIGAAVLLYALARTSLGDTWYYYGGLTVVGVIAALTIVGVVCCPVLARRLDWGPLRWIGRRSYGIYLFHWPLLVGFTLAGVTAWMLPWVTLVATLCLTVVSYARWEQPVRVGALDKRALGAVLVALALVAPMSAVVASENPTTDTDIDFAASQRQLDERISRSDRSATIADPRLAQPARPSAGEWVGRSGESPQVVTGGDTTVQDEPALANERSLPEPAPLEPARVGFFGDSKAVVLALGLDYRNETLTTGFTIARLGCPLVRVDWKRESRHHAPYAVGSECDWLEVIETTPVDDRALDVAIVWFGTWDIAEVKGSGFDGRWVSIDDDGYREWLFDEMTAFADEIVAATGAQQILWMTLHHTDSDRHPARIDRYNELVAELAAQHHAVTVADIGAWVVGTGELDRLFPDQSHPSDGLRGEPNTAREIGDRWLDRFILDALGR